MKVDIWKDLAKRLASVIEKNAEDETDNRFYAGYIEIYDEEEFAKFLEQHIKKFANERIAKIFFMVDKNEDISETG